MGNPGRATGNRSVFSAVKHKYLSLDRWAQLATVLALPVAVLGTLASLAALNPGHGPANPAPAASTPAAVAPPPAVVSTPQPPAAATSQGSIPAEDLGSWGGFVKQVNGLTERMLINLNQGTPGSNVGTFSNQTANCEGTITLNGRTVVTMNGSSVPAADLNLITTQDPDNDCSQTAEAYVASNGSILAYEVVTAGTVQGTLQSPLAGGNLSH